MNPSDCERYETCSANICPLDKNWAIRQHLNGERVCFYLIQANKSGAKAIFYDVGKGNLYELMMLVGVEILTRHYPIRHVVHNSKKTASRMKVRLGAIASEKKVYLALEEEG